MTRHRIGGTLDLHALAVLHRPDDPETLRREARHLLAIGLSVADAGRALGLTAQALADLLTDQEHGRVCGK